MATKNFMTLGNLETYDGLIKQYIGTEDAKSIKSLTVVGNTVSFYKTADASGNPSYTVNLPDVSGFMDKIASATGGKIVTSTAEGQVAESATAISDLATNAFVGTIPSGATATTVTGYAKEVADSKDSAITAAQNAADAAQGEVDALETLVGTIPATATATDVVGYAAEVADAAADAVADDLDALDQSLATVAKTGDAGDVTYDNTESGLTATDVQAALDELADASAGGVASKTVWLKDDEAVTTGYLKTYGLYQGANSPDHATAPATLIGKIDIPKDLVVTSGEIVVNPTGQPAGTYLKLVIANQTEPVYINVADLCDVYTAEASAAQVQLAISSTNEISATIVAGSIDTTELASGAVTTAKIADDAVTAAKVSISAHSETQTAGADGLAISVTTTDGQVSAVSGSIAANTYEPYGTTATAIAALDATESQTAGADGLALSITEVDGVITSISGSIAANTYDGYGAASTAKSEVIGTSSDAASADTVNGAKAYADASTAAIATADIQALFS